MKIEPSTSLARAAMELAYNSINERLTKKEFAEMLEYAWTITISDIKGNEPSLYEGWIETNQSRNAS